VGIASEFAPAKINLFLAITGRRPDGFHNLVSVAAPLEWGDRLRASPAEAPSLECRDAAVPTGDENLVIRAARAYTAAGGQGSAHFVLKKEIPMGAGLGGGSSDAVAALVALERLSPRPLGPAALRPIAAALGSDCPLFLESGPVIMRGRGERLEPLSSEIARRLRGRRLLVFKPGFGISTPWAYGRLAATKDYVPEPEAEARLAAWIGDPVAPAEALVFNSMERAAFPKYVALESLLLRLQDEFGLRPRMSGSGSACFAFLAEGIPVDPIRTAILDSWGSGALVQETRIF
jgi:4-diphosphocytidyl-2-C-methyl-D-erythritol kinase